MNPWEPVVFGNRVTVTAHATVEVKCLCGRTIRMHSTIPGFNSTVVCPNYACRREYQVEEISVVERHRIAPCPEAILDARECKLGPCRETLMLDRDAKAREKQMADCERLTEYPLLLAPGSARKIVQEFALEAWWKGYLYGKGEKKDETAE